jgi:hypothetical protein
LRCFQRGAPLLPSLPEDDRRLVSSRDCRRQPWRLRLVFGVVVVVVVGGVVVVVRRGTVISIILFAF